MKKEVLILNIKFIIQMMVVAIYLIGCSGANTVPTLEATPTDAPTLIPTTTNTPLPPTETPSPTSVPFEVGISGLKQNPEDYEIWLGLSEMLDKMLNNPQYFITPSSPNIFLGPKNQDIKGITEDQVRAGEVIENILLLACRYGVMPEVEEGDQRIRPFVAVFNNTGLDVENAGISPKLDHCLFSTETLNEFTRQGWTMIISLNGENTDPNIIRNGTENDRNIILSPYSLTELKKIFEPLSKTEKLFEPVGWNLSSSLMPNDHSIALFSPPGNISKIDFIPPGYPLLEAYEYTTPRTPKDRAILIYIYLATLVLPE